MRFPNVQAVRKFKQGIDIDGSRHDTKWCLGNAYTSQVGNATLLAPCVHILHVLHQSIRMLTCSTRLVSTDINNVPLRRGSSQQTAARRSNSLILPQSSLTLP
jgi:Plant specific mitochondrial import receptor subunit TOM20